LWLGALLILLLLSILQLATNWEYLKEMWIHMKERCSKDGH
jgi:hypothetical protein